MSGELDQDSYRDHLVLAYATARALRVLPVAQMLEAIGTAHAIGPIADPTLYREQMPAMREDEAVLRILVRARTELDRLPWPEAGEVARV